MTPVSLSFAPLAAFEDLNEYRRHFMDVDIWLPYIQFISQRQRLPMQVTVRPGLAGTYPTFIVNEGWVIKFYGRLFQGGHAFQTERQVAQVLMPVFTPQTSKVKIPNLLAEGSLLEDPNQWPWPYLVFEYLPGISIGQVYSELSYTDKFQVAHQMAELVRRLHSVALVDEPGKPASWTPYLAFLRRQRARLMETYQRTNTLPAHLLEQLEDYVYPAEQLINFSSSPHLVHADLTQDHLLGEMQAGRWVSTGLIDFGDAMNGDLFYELAALHMDLFGGDKRLLAVFLKEYCLDNFHANNFARKALSTALLHQFNVFQAVFSTSTALKTVETLDELASQIWDVESID